MSRPGAPPLRSLRRVWVILIALTSLSFAAYRDVIASPVAVMLLIVGLAYVKARLVLLNFMELRFAPIGWRIAFELWLVAASGVILAFGASR